MKHPSPIVLTIDAVLRPLGVLIYLAIAAVSYPTVSFFWPRHRTWQIRVSNVLHLSPKPKGAMSAAEHAQAGDSENGGIIHIAEVVRIGDSLISYRAI